MAGQPRSPKKLRGHDQGIFKAFGSFFVANVDTIRKLETAAGRYFGGGHQPYDDRNNNISPYAAFRRLNMAFFESHALAEQVRKTPPPSELCKAYDQVLRAGQALLLSLGLDVNDDHAALFRKDWRELCTASGVLNALVHELPVDPIRLISEDILNLIPTANAADFAPPGNRPIIEAVRNLGYLLTVAKSGRDLHRGEKLSPGPVRTTQTFNSALLQHLVECYKLMFGETPKIAFEPIVVEKDGIKSTGMTVGGNEIYLGDGDPVVEWTREILKIALSNIKPIAAPPSATASFEQPVEISESLNLAESIRDLLRCSGRTMAEYMSDAIRAAKSDRAVTL
jgi:hypothetical protein